MLTCLADISVILCRLTAVPAGSRALHYGPLLAFSPLLLSSIVDNGWRIAPRRAESTVRCEQKVICKTSYAIQNPAARPSVFDIRLQYSFTVPALPPGAADRDSLIQVSSVLMA